MSEDTNLEPSLHSLCIPQGGLGRGFLGGSQIIFFGKAQGGICQNFGQTRGGGGGGNIFSPFFKKETLFFGIFFLS